MNLIPFRTKRSTGMEPGGLITMSDFRNEMNRLFEGFFSRSPTGPSWFESTEPGSWTPAIDLSESGTQIHVRAELPGIDPKDVEVSVSEDRLLISGEKKSVSEGSADGWTHRESHFGSFSRAITLPEAVDSSKVTAKYDKGVLTVELTKSPSSAARKVLVRTT